jgi:hypothetical protein
LPQIAICSCHNANVYAKGQATAKTLELLLLKSAQQLGLKLQWNLANLVQKQGPPMRHFQSARSLRECSPKRPFLVAEEYPCVKRLQLRQLTLPADKS